MLHQAQRVKYAVLHAPQLIEDYMKPPYNKKITLTTLYKMLHRSCGIEIECFGSLLYEFDNNVVSYRRSNAINQILRYYGIMDYDEDNAGRDAVNPGYDNSNFNEHKIRIKDFSQLCGLYEILNDMKKYCRLNMGSGIHIHVDVSDVASAFGHDVYGVYGNLFKQYLNTKLDEIEQIFYPGEHYTGTYNSYKEVCAGKTPFWVAIRPDKTTLEFRIAPMTFDYTTIVTWLVKLNNLVDRCILSNPKIASKCNVRSKIKDTKESKPIFAYKKKE
jgi:hypothetical protein